MIFLLKLAGNFSPPPCKWQISSIFLGISLSMQCHSLEHLSLRSANLGGVQFAIQLELMHDGIVLPPDVDSDGASSLTDDIGLIAQDYHGTSLTSNILSTSTLLIETLLVPW